MQFTLKMKDGKRVTLRFSMYFLNRVCELTGSDLNTIYPMLIGDFDPNGSGAISGGLMADLKIRAIVVAAAWEAESFADGDYRQRNPVTKEVFDVLENVDGGIMSEQWAEIYKIIIESLTASLPKEPTEVKKKEASVPKSRSTTSKTRVSGK